MNQVKDRGCCVVCGKLRKQKYIQETNMYEDKSIIINVAVDEQAHGSSIDLRAHAICYKDIVKKCKTNLNKTKLEDLIKFHPKTSKSITIKTATDKTLYIDYN